MSSKKIDVALTFLKTHPEAAAAILEKQPVELVADFIKELPHTYAAVVIDKTLPQYTAKLCRILPLVISEAFMSELSIGLVAAILRHCDQVIRKQLLGVLPEKTKIGARLLLKYSENSVGAWMIPNATVLPNDCTIEEAKCRITQNSDYLGVNFIPVIDRERKFCGQVDFLKLYRTNSNFSITSVMEESMEPIAGRTSLTSALTNPVWKRYDTVAVDNMKGNLIGILRHMDLRKGLDHISVHSETQKGSDPITGLSEVYTMSLLGVFGSLAEVADPTKITGANQ